ncbi:MAG: HlyD family type I secretion periplasmic adaptor subunit [Porticoccaceae bacterium]
MRANDNVMRRLRDHFTHTDPTELKYMSYSSEAMLQQLPGLSRIMLWVVCLFVVIMVLWASIAKVDEITRGQGKVVPSSNVQVVQNLEGGILAKLLVEEGDLVNKDQPVLHIDDTLLSSSHREQSLQISQLQAKAARLQAESTGVEFDDVLAQLGVELDAVIAEQERQLFVSRRLEFELRSAALQQRVDQKFQELSAAIVNRDSVASSFQLLKKELDITRPMVDSGAISPVELLRLERQVNDLRGELERAKLAVPQLESEHLEAQQNADTLVQTFTSEARRDLNDVTSELGRLQESNQAYADRVQRTIVRSPVRGTVKQIKVKTLGGVIQPGMDLVEIVPIDDSLVLDAKISPVDIAFIHPGQMATVKFTAYDFSIHGGLPAKVVHISPDTMVDEEGVSYYQVRLVTDSSHLGKGEEPLPIIPGMAVQVDILTGRKTIMGYLLKPITKTKELAFRER